MPPPFTARSIDLIVIHCSATPNGDSLDRGVPGQPGFKTAADIIDGWHAERGFVRTLPVASQFNPALQHIGYHFVINCEGELLTGRHPSEPGAHVRGYNANSLGVCLTGTDAFRPTQWDALASLVRHLCTEHRVPLAPARRNGDQVFGGLCGHRDLSPDLNHDERIQPWEWLKICPGFDVAAWLERDMSPLSDEICEVAR